MAGMFDEFVEGLLKREGGYVNRPDDSGGPTNFGITESVARRYGYKGAIKDLPRTMAIQIYREMYWEALSLDKLENLCPAIVEKLADIAVNQGVGRAGEFCQRLLNVLNDKGRLYADLRVDGAIGPATVATLRKFLSIRARDGETVFLRGLNALQGAFYITLAERREKDEAFVYGWLLNRVA